MSLGLREGGAKALRKEMTSQKWRRIIECPRCQFGMTVYETGKVIETAEVMGWSEGDGRMMRSSGVAGQHRKWE